MDTHDELRRLIRSLDKGMVTGTEFLCDLLTYLTRFPEQQDEVLTTLRDHPNECARAAIPAIQEALRKRAESEQSKDIHHLRRTSPLQPGSRLALGGGYTAAYAPPRWLNGRESYRGTFLAFVQGNVDSRPVAFVELDEEVATGQFKGRHALLRLLHEGTWTAAETVVVHIVDALPDDIDAFYALDPFPYHKAAETHASYQLLQSPYGGPS
jgi:hypothetical protein